jgi:hypothetical protein
LTPPALATLERLYAVPPDAFVRERNTAAAALKKAGQPAEARALMQLRRPSPALWVINQLARSEARRLAAFLQSVDRARNAQLRDPRAASTALSHLRAELEALVHRASELLQAQRHPPAPEARERVSNTLLGAAVDWQLVHDLRHGRLAVELPAPGFEVLIGAPPGKHPHPVGVRPAPPPANDPGRDESRVAAARQRRQREADELDRVAAAQLEIVAKRMSEVEGLLKGLAAARERLRAARRAARAAAAAARKARRARP